MLYEVITNHAMQRIYVHPLPVRIWHWINAFGFVAMIITGFQIRYIGSIDLMSFRTAVVLHDWIGFVLIGNRITSYNVCYTKLLR